MNNKWGTITAVALALALTACAPAKSENNATACKLFEDGYNQLTDSVKNGDAPDVVKAQVAMLPSRIHDAMAKAEGDVAVAMRSSSELSTSLGAGVSDAGTAFFMSVQPVADKCNAAGTPINLHDTH